MKDVVVGSVAHEATNVQILYMHVRHSMSRTARLRPYNAQPARLAAKEPLRETY